jgi:hypothetical protein
MSGFVEAVANAEETEAADADAATAFATEQSNTRKFTEMPSLTMRLNIVGFITDVWVLSLWCPLSPREAAGTFRIHVVRQMFLPLEATLPKPGASRAKRNRMRYVKRYTITSVKAQYVCDIR